MRAVIICPADRPPLEFLSRSVPLALVPVLGRSLLDLTLAQLATAGANEVLVLAADRPEQVRAAVGRGEAWGIKVEVAAEQRELSVAEVQNKYPVSDPQWIVVLDRLPGPAGETFADCAAWFAAVGRSIAHALPDRVGMREFAPGVFVSSTSRLAPSAQLLAPCWVGPQSWIGPNAVIGPNTVVEARAYVDQGAEVVESFVGPETYVGTFTEVRTSLAWGRRLLNWRTGSAIEITDAFLLGELSGRAPSAAHRPGWVGRLVALVALLVSWPVLGVGWLRTRRSDQALLTPRSAVWGQRTCRYYELSGVTGLWKRWPQLWSIGRGEFAWVGNRPLTPAQAAELATEFEQLWLAAPIGLFSLADALGCGEEFTVEAKAHASYYAVQRSRRMDWEIFGRGVRRLFGGTGK